MTKHAAVIAGGGPTSLMLAGELALARVDLAIVEVTTERISELAAPPGSQGSLYVAWTGDGTDPGPSRQLKTGYKRR